MNKLILAPIFAAIPLIFTGCGGGDSGSSQQGASNAPSLSATTDEIIANMTSSDLYHFIKAESAEYLATLNEDGQNVKVLLASESAYNSSAIRSDQPLHTDSGLYEASELYGVPDTTLPAGTGTAYYYENIPSIKVNISGIDIVTCTANSLLDRDTGLAKSTELAAFAHDFGRSPELFGLLSNFQYDQITLFESMPERLSSYTEAFDSFKQNNTVVIFDVNQSGADLLPDQVPHVLIASKLNLDFGASFRAKTNITRPLPLVTARVIDIPDAPVTTCYNPIFNNQLQVEVSGVLTAALILVQSHFPEINAVQAAQILLDTADKSYNGYVSIYSAGMLDLKAALAVDISKYL